MLKGRSMTWPWVCKQLQCTSECSPDLIFWLSWDTRQETSYRNMHLCSEFCWNRKAFSQGSISIIIKITIRVPFTTHCTKSIIFSALPFVNIFHLYCSLPGLTFISFPFIFQWLFPVLHFQTLLPSKQKAVSSFKLQPFPFGFGLPVSAWMATEPSTSCKQQGQMAANCQFCAAQFRTTQVYVKYLQPNNFTWSNARALGWVLF